MLHSKHASHHSWLNNSIFVSSDHKTCLQNMLSLSTCFLVNLSRVLKWTSSSSCVVNVTLLSVKYWTLLELPSTLSSVICSCKCFLVVREIFQTQLTILRTIRVGIFRGRSDLERFAVKPKSLYFFYYCLNCRFWYIKLFAYISVVYSSFIPANN